jgi:hypothetical protein
MFTKYVFQHLLQLQQRPVRLARSRRRQLVALRLARFALLPWPRANIN